MRIILATVLFFVALTAKTQTLTFTKASYTFWDTANLNNTWWRNMAQALTATIDTVKKQLTVPYLQLWANTSTRRNLVSGVATTTGDTTLSAVGTLNIKISAIVRYDFGVTYFYLQDGLYGLLFGNELAITYPKWNGYIRVVEFGKP